MLNFSGSYEEAFLISELDSLYERSINRYDVPALRYHAACGFICSMILSRSVKELGEILGAIVGEVWEEVHEEERDKMVSVLTSLYDSIKLDVIEKRLAVSKDWLDIEEPMSNFDTSSPMFEWSMGWIIGAEIGGDDWRIFQSRQKHVSTEQFSYYFQACGIFCHEQASKALFHEVTPAEYADKARELLDVLNSSLLGLIEVWEDQNVKEMIEPEPDTPNREEFPVGFNVPAEGAEEWDQYYSMPPHEAIQELQVIAQQELAEGRNEDYLETMLKLGEFLSDFGDDGEAEEHFEHMLAFEPKDPHKVREQLLIQYVLSGSVAKFEALLQRYPEENGLVLWAKAALEFQKDGDSEQSREALLKAKTEFSNVPKLTQTPDELFQKLEGNGFEEKQVQEANTAFLLIPVISRIPGFLEFIRS